MKYKGSAKEIETHDEGADSQENDGGGRHFSPSASKRNDSKKVGSAPIAKTVGQEYCSQLPLLPHGLNKMAWHVNLSREDYY